jgi:hypothetical protein
VNAVWYCRTGTPGIAWLISDTRSRMAIDQLPGAEDQMT